MATLSTQQIQFEQALIALLESLGIDGSGDGGGFGGFGTISDARLAIILLAKVKLDEILPNVEGLQFTVEGSVNVSDPLNIMCNALMDEAAKRVLMNCPTHYLDPVKSNITTGTADSDDNKIGTIPLPANFLRFISLKMADWYRSVPASQIISQSHPLYNLQVNKYTRGGTVKPVAVLAHREVGGSQVRVIEYYSVSSSHAIDYLYYIQETVAENVQSNLIDALTWVIAGMVLQITERVDLAKVAFEQEQLCYQNLPTL